MNTDILIIGGGISGLHTAYKLQKLGIDFILLEARERLGGRILSKNYSASDLDSYKTVYNPNHPAYDLGPSWFWPGQTNIETLINELNLQGFVFPQQSSGEAVYEDQQGNIQKGFFGISMEGTYRLNGGIQQLIFRLEEKVNSQRVLKSTQVKSIEFINDQMITSASNVDSNNETPIEIKSKKVIVALPPRIAMSVIEFKPSLANSRISELNSYATWMAGHAKVLATYEKAFWLEQGLSGDAISHLGPLREIHDASSYPASKSKNGYALFGFVGVHGSDRKGNEGEIRKTAIAQLVRLFGEEAANPIDIVLQDWAQQKYTATDIDQSMSGGHASSSITNFTESSFDDRLIWSGTETADYRRGYNGLLEGALEASERTLSLL